MNKINRFQTILDAYMEAKKGKASVGLGAELESKLPVSENQVDKEGVKTHYASSKSLEESMDYLAFKLKGIDLKAHPTMILCRDPAECKQLRMELEGRGLKNVLVCHSSDGMETIMPLWPERLAETILIVSRDLWTQFQLGGKTIGLLVINEMAAEAFQVNSEILCLSSNHLGMQKEETCVTSCPDSKDECLPKAENFLQMGMHYVNFGIMAWSLYPLINCNYITGVPGITSEIRSAIKSLADAPERARNVQRLAWPHLASGHSIILIGHEKCGKSWSYIPILCQRVYDAIRKGNLDWTGPICIVMAVDKKEGKQLAQTLCEIMDFYSTDGMELIVTLLDACYVDHVSNKLSGPCGILITTVDLMLQLEQFDRPGHIIFDVKAMRSLVLDNLDNMWRDNPLKTPKLIKYITSKFKFSKQQTQLIITSHLWMEELMRSQLMPLFSNILLVFEDGLEASAYGRIKLNLKFVSDQDYEEGTSLLKALASRDLEGERIVIVCYKADDSLHLSELLEANNVDHFNYFANDKASQELIKSQQGIIITIDEMLASLKCGHVDLLINYTFSHTWHRFKARFNLFYANYKSQDQSKPQPSQALIFFNKRETEEVWLFCDYVLKHNMVMHRDWFDHLHEFRMERETIFPRFNVNLCSQMLAYGNCYRRTCRYRHHLTSAEVEPPICLPKRGTLYFRVLNCDSPANLTAKLLHLKDPPNQPIEYEKFNVRNEVHAYYRHNLNRTGLKNASIGDTCVMKYDDCYQRVTITSIASDPTQIGVRQLDWGTRCFKMPISELFECVHFQNELFQAVELRLTGIMPYSMERLWTTHEKRFVRNKFFKYLKY